MPTPASRGVIYLGRIPHGFYEDEMRQYFTQFGTVTRLRLSRNKKTGKSKHYAFVEFKDGDVADVVASTMNGYLMFGQVLVCKRLPHSQVHPELFKGANRKFRPANLVAKEMKSINVPKSREAVVKTVKNLIAQEKARVAKIKAMGIDYDFSDISFAALAAKAGLVEGAAPAPSAPAPAPVVEEKPAKKAKEAAKKAPVVEEPALEKQSKKGKRKAPSADAEEVEAPAAAANKKAKSAGAAPAGKPSPAKQAAGKKAVKKARR
ncbi:hypothetical protein BCR44DRAFT_118253 [Catenaria anguillulae PL171]|uniref:RRM domain-containing protein n=1 Tax=Catenaria anguillulae PL171 TaxID=765915 RepID=A0A1Y2HH48_9FUNG|nr:hypothetical protein BCR44DRAFT_118253 [Catenaria anguillulae PL171]